MSRVLLIANPAAARTRPGAVEAVRRVFTAVGWRVDVEPTGGPGDARRLAGEGVAAGVSVVAVFGGDGTTMQAAAALVGSGVPLGLIPGGTGNLLAGNLRLPRGPVAAARAILRGRPRPVDLGRVERGDGDAYFAVACGAGYDARVMVHTPSRLKRRWKMGAYVATTLRLIGEFRAARHRITMDGVTQEVDAAMVLVANCGEIIPPWIRLDDRIAFDDGILDLVVIRAGSFSDGVRAVWEIVREGPADPAFVAYGRGHSIRVESDPVEPVQLDGEPGGETPFTATVVPGAIRVVAPSGA